MLLVDDEYANGIKTRLNRLMLSTYYTVQMKYQIITTEQLLMLIFIIGISGISVLRFEKRYSLVQDFMFIIFFCPMRCINC